jgi:hypothetical protein
VKCYKHVSDKDRDEEEVPSHGSPSSLSLSSTHSSSMMSISLDFLEIMEKDVSDMVEFQGNESCSAAPGLNDL